MKKVLLVFLDGVGIGDNAEYNPFVTATLPRIRSLLGGEAPVKGLGRTAPDGVTLDVVASDGSANAGATLLALEATLGVQGTPQSGTGQTTLFTGRNAADMNGRHFGPWVPSALRDTLRRESVLARAVRAGRSVTFANAYPRELIDAALENPPKHKLPAFLNAGPPLAAAGAGVFVRDVDDLRRHDAVASEITNEGWRARLGYVDLPVVTPRDAGVTLGGIANRYELTLFAHYATDTVGHSRDMAGAIRALETVDAFLDGITTTISGDVMLVVASDHGNIEDIRTGHTRNPAFGLLYGTDHERLSEGVTSLTSVAPLICSMLAIA